MKKILLFFAITAIVANTNAQWFLAGSIGLNISDQIVITKNNEKQTERRMGELGFSIAPKVGYYFNEKLAIGLCLSAGINFTTYSSGQFYYEEPYTINWDFLPFVRRSVLNYKKFSIILEGKTGVGGSHSFYELDEKKKNYSNTLAVGVLNVTPILGFKLTDRIQVEAGLHFLNLGYNIDMTKEEYIDACCGNPNRKNTTKHDINIGFNSSSILVASRLQFGIIYKF